LLKEWTLGEAFDINGTPTFDTTWPNVVSSVTVIWPDGTGGTYTGHHDQRHLGHWWTPTRSLTPAP
jgi:hypothetical protein